MLVVSLTTLVQEAAASGDAKHLSGNIQNAADLFNDANLERLDAQYAGVFAYLAFYPATDQPIVEYIKQGSLASDSGPRILVLFTLDSQASSATSLPQNAFGSWLQLDASEHPSYRLIRTLFGQKATPPLPGIAFLPQLTGEHEVAYVPLQGLSDAAAVRDKLRTLFSVADHTYQELRGDQPRSQFTDRFAVQLQKDRVPFETSGSTSLSEWLVRGYQFVGDHAGDIVSVAQLGMSLGLP